MLLKVEDLETAYGSSQVLFKMALEVAAGEMCTLLGRNGMGKTTTVRSIMGLTRARNGAISFRDRRIERETPDRIARLGIALVPEGRQIFAHREIGKDAAAFGHQPDAELRDPVGRKRRDRPAGETDDP